jgi:hypothetical protein
LKKNNFGLDKAIKRFKTIRPKFAAYGMARQREKGRRAEEEKSALE